MDLLPLGLLCAVVLVVGCTTPVVAAPTSTPSPTPRGPSIAEVPTSTPQPKVIHVPNPRPAHRAQADRADLALFDHHAAALRERLDAAWQADAENPYHATAAFFDRDRAATEDWKRDVLASSTALHAIGLRVARLGRILFHQSDRLAYDARVAASSAEDIGGCRRRRAVGHALYTLDYLVALRESLHVAPN